MKKSAIIMLVFAMTLSIVGCRMAKSITAQNCSHEYYLEEYTAPTDGKNGAAKYTCKKCGNSYTEVLPALGSSANQADSNGSYNRSSTKFNLSDLPTYSISGVGNYAYSITSEAVDTKGYKHKNVVRSCTYTSEDYDPGYVRYDLGGKYSSLEGTIYLEEDGAGDYVWLEFYDGEDFLYSTEKLDSGNYTVSFSFDISGVEFLTIYPKRVGGGAWETPKYIIWDTITVSK